MTGNSAFGGSIIAPELARAYTGAPEFSIVVATYNRADQIRTALDQLLALRADSPSHEIIVVDNNSKDGTRAVVESYAELHPHKVRYLFEGRQGVSHARNSGVAAARAPVVAFTDDDVWVSPDWLIAIRDGFARFPAAAFIGGKCLPRWTTAVPDWLTADLWAPLALFDYGDAPFATSIDYQRCQGAGNLAIRRELFDRIGGFDAATQHAVGAVSAAEDHQLNLRVWQLGLSGWYVPEMVIYSDVPAHRIQKRYYRRWYRDHGRAVVHLVPPGHRLDARGHVIPAADARYLFGVPTTFLAETAWHARQWLGAVLRRRSRTALHHELAVIEAWGFIRESRRSRRSRRTPMSSHPSGADA